jgi:hypothetical protein
MKFIDEPGIAQVPSFEKMLAIWRNWSLRGEEWRTTTVDCDPNGFVVVSGRRETLRDVRRLKREEASKITS